MNAVLERWNELAAETAAEEILPCCGSRTWAREVVKRRPLTDGAALVAASDAVWWALAEADWLEAFASHPRIGEVRAAGTATEQSLTWSVQEQSAAVTRETDVKRLAESNRAYEARFGRTFLIFANGRSAGEILQVLETRMKNDPETELREAAAQQSRITRLRLERWMGAEKL